MIITCPNCNKKFKIDNSLIPDEGRDLQCGSCNHVWLYKIEEENSKILELTEETEISNIETKVDKNNEEIVENKNSLTNIKTESEDEEFISQIKDNINNNFESSLLKILEKEIINNIEYQIFSQNINNIF